MGEGAPEFITFVFDVPQATMATFSDVSIFPIVQDSFEDGDLEGIEVLASVLINNLIQLINEGLRVHGDRMQKLRRDYILA